MTENSNLPAARDAQPPQASLPFTWRLVAMQWVGNLVLALLAIGWLQIPDSHVWQFFASILIGIGLAAGLVWLYRATFSRMLHPAKASPFWLSAISLLLVLAAVITVYTLVGAGRNTEVAYASYWNSKLSANLRVTLSFTRLITLLDLFYDLLEFVAAALLLPFTLAAVTSGFSRITLSRILGVYRRVGYWGLALLAWIAGIWTTGKLIDWTPKAGVTGQVVSLLLRLGVAYTFDILLWCLILAVVARYLANPSLVERRSLTRRTRG